MVDVSPVLSTETPDVADSAPADTQLAEAGHTVTVTEALPQATSIQVLAPGEALHLDFDAAAVAKAEIKDGNLEITFDNGGVVIIQGYEAWAHAGGEATGPQGGVLDMARLISAADATATTAAAEATPQVCAAPSESAHVVQVPVPAPGVRITLAAQPGDALQLACSFRDVAGKEVGDTLEMTFPGRGVVVVENFSAWLAAEGATITDCVCGGVNLADFIVALGMVPEDVLPAAGEASNPQGGPQGNDLTGSGFTPGPGPEILSGYPYPHILPPTALNYGVPEPEQTFFPTEDDLGSPDADDDGSGTDNPPRGGNEEGCVDEDGLGAIDSGEGGPVNDPTLTTVQGNVLDNDTFGPDGPGGIVGIVYEGDPANVLNGDVDGVTVGDITTITAADGSWVLEFNNAIGQYTFTLLSAYEHEGIQGANEAFEHFRYTIEDKDGDKDSAVLTICIEDGVPTAVDDPEICVIEDTPANEGAGAIGGNVLLNDDEGPDGATITSITYDNGTATAVVPDGGSVTVTTALGGTLTLSSNGDWNYTPPAELDQTNGEILDGFGYTLTDSDGDVDTATQPICIQDAVRPPTVTLDLAGDDTCVKEDSVVTNPDNQVSVHAEAIGDDVLTQIVITGFPGNGSGWGFDISGLNSNGSTASFNADGTVLTIVLPPGSKTFDGMVGVQPPPDSDVDLSTLTATATAAAADDPNNTLDSSTAILIDVDAVADQPTVDIEIVDGGDANGSFQTGESGTGSVTATFGDAVDGSELHTVVVNVPAGFSISNVTGGGVYDSNVGTITWSNVGASLNATFTVTNVNAAEGTPSFTATATANENPPSDQECDPEDNIATDDDADQVSVQNVGTPTISLDLAGDDTCVKEDSLLSSPNNVVTVQANAAVGDELTQIVITGFQSNWQYDFTGMNQAGVQSVNFNAGTGTLTIPFNGAANPTSYTGTFAVQPPADSDIDHPTLNATVTAADQDDPQVTATGNGSILIDVDAVADQPTVDIEIVDGGDANGSFQTGESGTGSVTATFGDAVDGSELHTVVVNVPAGFSISNVTGGGVYDSNVGTITWSNVGASLNATFTVTNVNAAEGTPSFTATATANENPPSDQECDPEDNIATDDDADQVSVQNVGTPTISLDLAGDDTCVKEDSLLSSPNNVVTVQANAAVGDELTQIVITGFQSNWQYDFTGMNQAGVQSVNFNAGTGTLTIPFNGAANPTSYTGTFAVQPPADSDIDHPTLNATVTAADQDDPQVTATGNGSILIDVDAVADQPTVDIEIVDGGDANGSFQTGESGTGSVTATFGDAADGSELHTVVVNVPAGFSISNVTGGGVYDSNAGTVTWSTVGASLNATFTVTNVNAAEGTPSFTATATANENPPSDQECDPEDNIATDDDADQVSVQNVGTPTISLDLAGDDTCVKEDSLLSSPNNVVTVQANAAVGDELTQIVITGFQSNWQYDFTGMNQAGVQSVNFNAGTGTLTITFNGAANPTSYTGTFAVQPPADSDIDHPTLNATVTAADQDDPQVTATGNGSITIHGDAVLDRQANIVQTAPVVGNESASAQTFALNLDFALVSAGFVGSLAGGADTDGSESVVSVTISIDAGTLSLANSALGTLTDNGGGNYTLNATQANLEAAVESLRVTVPGNFDGVVHGTINTTTDEANTPNVVPGTEIPASGVECETNDNVQNGTFNFTVTVNDGVPIAYNNEQCTAEKTFNLVYIADVSGSMDDDDVDPNTPGFQTRVQLMKEALLNMTQQYASLGTEVTLTIIAFASGAVTTDGGTDKDGARVSQTFTFNSTSDHGYLDALAFINSLAIGMDGLTTQTEYDDALLAAQDLLTGQLAAQPLDGGPENIVYFLSDGKPNPASNNAPDGWQTFVNNNDIEVIAVGIGKDIPVNDPDLAAVEDNGDTPINVANELDLNQTLLDTVPGPVSGNVITDPAEPGSGSPVGSVDGGGPDGIARLASITHDGVIYTLSADGTTVTSNPPGAVFTYNAATGELSFQTDLGGTLTIDLLGAGMGDYTYEPPLAVKHGAPGSATDDEVTEVFTYTIQDGDGDKASADLGICIEDGEPVAIDDHKIIGTKTFGSGNVLTDGTDDTFGPDGPASPAITQVKFGNTVFTDGTDGTIDGVIHATGAFGSLTLDANTGAYTYVRNNIQSTGTDVFEYTIKDGDGDTDNANLTIDLAPLNILNGTFVTNTNSVDQPLILTFQEANDPTHFSSRVYSLNAQGQQGTVAQDVGFFIENTQQFVYAVEAGKTTDFTNINVTDFSLEGAVINAPGGNDNWAIRYDNGGPNAPGAGGRHLAVSGVVTFSPASEIEQDAELIDGDKNTNAIADTDDATDNNGLDFIYGAAGNDTLTGGNSERDILNGGAGADQVSGGSGNDVLVFDKADVAVSGVTSGFIDGGDGADVLRIDDGALALFFNQTNDVIDLRGVDIRNIEVIGLTEEVASDATKGTTIKLEAEDVLDFSGDALGTNTLYIVGNLGDKVQLATTGPEDWVDGDGNAGNGVTKTGTFDDGQGQVFDIYSTESGGKLYVDTDITVVTVNS